MPYIFGNTGQSTCASPITAIQTTLVLASTVSFPVPSGGQFFMARIDDTGSPGSVKYEFVQCTTNNTGTSTLTIVRGQEGTAGQTFAAGATITHDLTALFLTAGVVRLDIPTTQTMAGPLGATTFAAAITVPFVAGGAGAASSYGTVPVKIDEQSPVGNTFNFITLPTGFRHLVVEGLARTTDAAAFQPLWMRFNADTGANYDYQSTVISNATNNSQAIVGATALRLGQMAGAGTYGGIFSMHDAIIPYYNSGTFNKTYSVKGQSRTGGGIAPAVGDMWTEQSGGFWRSNAAITTITIFPAAGNFAANSIFTLYGLP